MRPLLLTLLFVVSISVAQGGKKPSPAHTANDAVEITASALLDREALQQTLGSDLGGYYVVIAVQINPRDGKPLVIHLDDFLLRTDRNGEKATPFVPSQIAGSGALIVSQTGGGRGMMGEDRGPIWGGYPGSGQRPRRMGGDGGGIGNTATSSAQASVQADSKSKPSPLLEGLKEKILPEKQTDQPVSGLLYFPMEGKQKLKDLELLYNGPAGKLSLRFR